ncbi:hypothetical protein D9611_012939 [Ephemerocybe angulata]|uniref:Uncharacterized protein n=1 Tax=Ephemerocybe angulata TaxID=980116 RepID=A0A8H5FFD2_9AGAR|nr:hypothetical protein D9611_012939 [Tulosesus angulatus]
MSTNRALSATQQRPHTPPTVASQRRQGHTAPTASSRRRQASAIPVASSRRGAGPLTSPSSIRRPQQGPATPVTSNRRGAGPTTSTDSPHQGQGGPITALAQPGERRVAQRGPTTATLSQRQQRTTAATSAVSIQRPPRSTTPTTLIQHQLARAAPSVDHQEPLNSSTSARDEANATSVVPEPVTAALPGQENEEEPVPAPPTYQHRIPAVTAAPSQPATSASLSQAQGQERPLNLLEHLPVRRVGPSSLTNLDPVVSYYAHGRDPSSFHGHLDFYSDESGEIAVEGLPTLFEVSADGPMKTCRRCRATATSNLYAQAVAEENVGLALLIVSIQSSQEMWKVYKSKKEELRRLLLQMSSHLQGVGQLIDMAARSHEIGAEIAVLEGLVDEFQVPRFLLRELSF